jgi:hypothetical protein
MLWAGILCGLGAAFSPAFGAEVARDGSRPADLVVVNARVVTCDENDTRAEAIAVADERIAYVGDDAGAADFIGPNTRVVDGHGRLLVPGFIDNHCHDLWIGGLGAYFVSLYEANSVEDVSRMVRECAAANPDHPFVMGIGWRYDYMPGGLPTKEMADEILPDRPLFLMSYGGETGWVNSITLERMQTKNPEALSHFRLERDTATGEPTGVLYEFYAVNPLEYFDPEELGPEVGEKMFAAMDRTLDEARSYGITALNDVQIYEPFIPYVLEYDERGGLDHIRARCSYYVSHHGVEEDALRESLTRWKELGGRSSEHLRLGDSVKLYVDGVSSNHTAYMTEPYSNNPDSTGHFLWETQEEFNRVVALIDAMEIQCCTHACGDAGIKALIDAYEYAREVNGPRDSRHRVEHCPNPRPVDYRRMADLDILAAMQPCHFYGDAMVEAALGPERLNRTTPWHSLEDAGVSISFGSDWCAGPMNPVLGFLVAGLRMNYHGNADWGEHEKISTESILRHYTIDCARALMWDDEIGSLEVGKYGDFAIYSEDILDVTSWWFLLTHELEPEKLDDFVVLTAVGGDIVYHRPGEKF